MRNIFKHVTVWDLRVQLLGKGIDVAALQFNTFLRPRRCLMVMLSGKLEQCTWTIEVGGLWEFCSTFLEQSALVYVSSQRRDKLT